MVSTRDLETFVNDNDVDRLRELLKDQHTVTSMSEFVINHSISAGKLPIIKMCFEEHPDIFIVADKHLYQAVYGKSLEMAMYILSRGPPLEAPHMLYDALFMKMYDVIDVLISHGLTVKDVDVFLAKKYTSPASAGTRVYRYCNRFFVMIMRPGRTPEYRRFFAMTNTPTSPTAPSIGLMTIRFVSLSAMIVSIDKYFGRHSLD